MQFNIDPYIYLQVKMILKDGSEIEVDQRLLDLSPVLKDSYEFSGRRTIKLKHDISGATFRRIIEWCEHHNYNPPHQREDENRPNYPKVYVDRNKKVPISKWDEEFFGKNHPNKAFFELLLAAHMLNLKSLYETCIDYIGNLLKDAKEGEFKFKDLMTPAMKEFGYFSDQEIIDNKNNSTDNGTQTETELTGSLNRDQ